MTNTEWQMKLDDAAFDHSYSMWPFDTERSTAQRMDAKESFESGAEFAIEQAVSWLRSDEAIESMAEYKNQFKTMPGILFWADEIERKFGRGGGCKQKTFR